MRKLNLRVCLATAVFIASSTFACSLSPAQAAGEPVLTIFHSPSCHRCHEVKNTVVPQIEQKFKNQIRIEYRDITNIENYKLLLSLEKKYQVELKDSLPIFYISGRFLNGEGAIAKPLENLINQALEEPFIEEKDLPVIDLIAYYKNFTFFIIVGLGLVDGVNPCAFTVVVFFISFLAFQGYRKKELAIVGTSFICALFISYILIGLGLFAFLYQLKNFWLISRIVNFSLGVFSIVLAILALYDFLRFRQTRDTEGLLLQLPQSIKNRIHYIVGLHYRKNKTGEEKEHKKNIPKLVLSAFITGLLVTILEAVCTGQTYLPTLGFILKTTPFKLQALAYILLYNLMFILPLAAVFLFALFGTTSEQFSKFLKRHMLAVKLAMVILFFILGVFLIWRA